jgi:TRAP-type C4-dicarboxylate transport system permease large subunit
VAVPLILPISQVFGINPVHLGVVFLVNLELGYLTPPVGMNLFLASYRFERPLTEVCKSALPYLAVLAGVLIAVTYLPGLLIGVG